MQASRIILIYLLWVLGGVPTPGTMPNYHEDTEPFISFFYVLTSITSFRYLSITCHELMAFYIICSEIYTK